MLKYIKVVDKILKFMIKKCIYKQIFCLLILLLIILQLKEIIKTKLPFKRLTNSQFHHLWKTITEIRNLKEK